MACDARNVAVVNMFGEVVDEFVPPGLDPATMIEFKELVNAGPGRFLHVFDRYDGEPIVGATVLADGIDVGRTGADGRLAVEADAIDRIEALGRDLVALRLVSGEFCLLRREAVTVIRLPPGGPDLVGDRQVDDVVDRLNLQSALDRLVAEQPAVHVTVDGSPDPVAGTFSRLGVDLLMVSCVDGS